MKKSRIVQVERVWTVSCQNKVYAYAETSTYLSRYVAANPNTTGCG